MKGVCCNILGVLPSLFIILQKIVELF